MPTLPPANLLIEPIVPGVCTTVFITWDQPANADDGQDIVGGGTYSAGIKVVSVIPGKGYRFTKGANDTSLVNGTETISINSYYFRAQGATVTLNGAGAVTAVITTMVAQTYRIWRNGEIIYEMPATEHQDQQPISDTDLSENTLYTYRVDSIDTSGGIASSPLASSEDCAPVGFVKQFICTGSVDPLGLAVDGNDNILAGGSFSGTLNCGRGVMTTAGNAFALFLAKFSPRGECLWSKRFTVTGTDATLSAIATNAAGDIFVTGSFAGTANFGGPSDITQVGVRRNGFLAKLNSYGDHVWSKGFQNIDGVVNAAYGCAPISVKVDSQGDVLIAGTFSGKMTFNAELGASQTHVGEVNTGVHTFLVKFTAAGAWVWERVAICSGDIFNTSMALDSGDNIVVVGSFNGTANFGTQGFPSADIPSSGFADIFVVKYDADGNHLWSRGGGGFAGDEAKAVAVDSSDNVLVGGHFFAPDGLPANFGGSNLFSPAGLSAFLAKYNSAGAHVWSQTFFEQPQSSDAITVMAIDPDDNLIAGGEFRSQGRFGGVSLPFTGAVDAWLGKYDSDGENTWTYAIQGVRGGAAGGQDTNDYLRNLAVDSEGNVIGCVYSDALNLTLRGTTFNNAGGYDAYLFKHGPTP